MGVVLVEGFLHLLNRNGVAEIALEDAQGAFRLITIVMPLLAEQVAGNDFFYLLSLCRSTEYKAAHECCEEDAYVFHNLVF